MQRMVGNCDIGFVGYVCLFDLRCVVRLEQQSDHCGYGNEIVSHLRCAISGDIDLSIDRIRIE